MQDFSVLLSVYRKERPEWMREALESVFEQTARPAEVVLVEDGPLTPELYDVIDELRREHAELKSVRLPVNGGLGRALNEGLRHCSYNLVARMDTDDVCKPQRFERQLQVFEQMPETDICSAWIEEFETDIEHITTIRCTPETSEEIYEFGKQRNPVNHMTAMFRKNAVIECGGYQDYPLFEDYYLWVRMLVGGYQFHTIQEALVNVRADSSMIARRGGWKYALTEIRLQFLFFGLHYISFGTFLHNIAIRFFTRIMPHRLRAWIYRKHLRTNHTN